MAQQLQIVRAPRRGSEQTRRGALVNGAKSIGVVAIAAAIVGGLSTPAAALEQSGSAREQALELAAIAQTMQVTTGTSSAAAASASLSGTTAAELADIRAAEQAEREAAEAAAAEAAEQEAAAAAAAGAQANASVSTGQAPAAAPAPVAQAPTAVSAGNGSILAVAQSQLGVPYVYGGTSPATGFDCSGFTMWVYGQFGYSLPRQSTAQSSAGTPIPAGSVAPGDLIVWPGHVAIYAGNDRIIHSPTAGSTVKYSQYSAMLGAFGTPQVRRFG